MDAAKKEKWAEWLKEARGVRSDADINEALKSRDITIADIEGGVVERTGRAVARGLTKAVGGTAELMTAPYRNVIKGFEAATGVDTSTYRKLMGEDFAGSVQEHVTGKWDESRGAIENMAEAAGELAPALAAPGSAVSRGAPVLTKAIASRFAPYLAGVALGEVGRQSDIPYAKEAGQLVGMLAPGGARSIKNSLSATDPLIKSGVPTAGGAARVPGGMMPADTTERAAQELQRAMRKVENPEISRKPFMAREPRKMLDNDMANAIEPRVNNRQALENATTNMFERYTTGPNIKIDQKFKDWVYKNPTVHKELKRIADTKTDETVETLLNRPSFPAKIMDDLRRGLSAAAENSSQQGNIRALSQEVTKRSGSPILKEAVDLSSKAQQARTAASKIDEMMNPRMERSSLDAAISEALGKSNPSASRIAKNVENVYRPIQRTRDAASAKKNLGEGHDFLGAASAGVAGAQSRALFETVRDAVATLRLSPKQAEKVVKAMADKNNPEWQKVEMLRNNPEKLGAAIRAFALVAADAGGNNE